jgi:hypothetical protein
MYKNYYLNHHKSQLNGIKLLFDMHVYSEAAEQIVSLSTPSLINYLCKIFRLQLIFILTERILIFAGSAAYVGFGELWSGKQIGWPQRNNSQLNSVSSKLFVCVAKIHVCFNRFDYLHLVASKMPLFLVVNTSKFYFRTRKIENTQGRLGETNLTYMVLGSRDRI